ncbi:MAG: hypothetical protein PCFJNLEI_02728 [Verrucomicrobiae bacterium]|nr:hypothetical protein [Verrucomicrobiae bacterium]
MIRANDKCRTSLASRSQKKTSVQTSFTLALTAIVVALSVGCAGYSVRYPLKKNDKWQGPPVGGILRVLPFDDQSTPLTQKEVKEGDFTYRLNSRDYYEKKEIAPSATKMVIEHLRKSGMFSDVIGQNSPKAADMELTGTLAEYYARGRVNKGAESTVLTFGIIGIFTMPLGILVFNGIGAGVTAGAKSEVDAAVTLGDMTLKKSGTGDILWQNTINVKTNFVGHFSHAYPQGVLMNADNCLRIGVNDMIQQIGTALNKDTARAVSQ